MKIDYANDGLLGDALQVSVDEVKRLKSILDNCLEEIKDDVKWIVIPHEHWKS